MVGNNSCASQDRNCPFVTVRSQCWVRPKLVFDSHEIATQTCLHYPIKVAIVVYAAQNSSIPTPQHSIMVTFSLVHRMPMGIKHYLRPRPVARFPYGEAIPERSVP